MKVLMFGWEFPPFNSGGLGVACEGLASALAQKNCPVLFVLPRRINCSHPIIKIIFADRAFQKRSNNLPSAYTTSKSFKQMASDLGVNNFYESDLFKEVLRYGQNAKKIAKRENFDIIHCHDWLSFPSGIAAKQVSGKPLVTQIHATEFDRTGNNPNPIIFAIEKIGLEKADAILAVSNFTKNIIVEKYGIDPNKITVAYNALNRDFANPNINSANELLELKKMGQKIVLFVGRITLQKGPDYFLKAAAKVLAQNPNVIFLMAGSGDMERQIIEQTAVMGIASQFLFTGFLKGDELKKAYLAADLFVMPSVSEPFGLTALEATALGAPVLVSKQSGVGEVVKNCLKVDFWDVDEITNKILACLTYQGLIETLKQESTRDLAKITWANTAQTCLNLYHELVIS